VIGRFYTNLQLSYFRPITELIKIERAELSALVFCMQICDGALSRHSSNNKASVYGILMTATPTLEAHPEAAQGAERAGWRPSSLT